MILNTSLYLASRFLVQQGLDVKLNMLTITKWLKSSQLHLCKDENQTNFVSLRLQNMVIYCQIQGVHIFASLVS